LLDGFFFCDGPFLLGVFFLETPVFLAERLGVFLLLGLFVVFFEDPRFLLLVFLVDGFRFDAAPAAFFAVGFLRGAFFTMAFLPLGFLFAADFLLGISFASKADSENRRLYRGNGLAEGFLNLV
jgi:hypothetical protein